MHVSTSTPAPGSSSSSSSSGTASSLNQGKLSGILSCVLYSFCSVAMVLANKAIPSTVPLELRSQMPQVGVLLFQCIIALGLVELARIFGYADYETVKWSVAKQWLPINLFFIAMLVTGFLSLVYASVPMVTIFKNLTNLVTVSGDWYLNNEDVSNLTVISILVMTAGAALAGLNDLEFSWIGYFWMIMNCLSTSGYVLYTKYATSNIKLSKLGMVYYNNLLSSVLLIPVCLYLGKFTFYL
jgi:GDP-mannose transporter